MFGAGEIIVGAGDMIVQVLRGPARVLVRRSNVRLSVHQSTKEQTRRIVCAISNQCPRTTSLPELFQVHIVLAAPFGGQSVVDPKIT